MFKEITENNFKDFYFYEDFMVNATIDEFALSQIPFYNAVKNFPRALCFLGYLIPDSENRLVVATNIYEEHGNGMFKDFHINTYYQYLCSLTKNPVIFNNPFIDDWIKSWFEHSDPFTCALQLSAIEYLYAPISASISKHLETLELYCEQKHYSKHAELDWEHGKELLDVAMVFRNDYTDEQIVTLFTQYQKDFLNVFRGMLVMTEKQVNKIAEEKIAFYYLREDSNISKNIGGHNIIMIGSGGEGVINHLSCSEEKEIILLDVNPNQLNLVMDKIKMIQFGKFPSEQNVGKFELIFKEIRNRILIDDKTINKEKLRYVLQDIFSKKNLSGIFTDDAVKYTKKDFAEHFYNVFIQENHTEFAKENWNNIFNASSFSYPEEIFIHNKTISTIQGFVTIESLNSVKFLNGKKADLIDLSNIGDWIPSENLKDIIKSCYELLETDGYLVLRKLLGDYNLEELMSTFNFKTIKKEDMFYEETIIGKK